MNANHHTVTTDPANARTMTLRQIAAADPLSSDGLAAFTELGRRAFVSGQNGAPMLDLTVCKAVQHMQVGEGAADIFRAYGSGYDRARDVAATAVIADDVAPADPAPGLHLSIDGDEVTVTGTIKGDPVHAAVLPRPWVWSRRAAGYVLPRSLTPLTRAARLETFKASCEARGLALDVEDTGARLSEAERRAARADRLADRAERHEKAAENAALTRDGAWAASHRIADGIPFGQPILVDHHSQRRAERDRDRMISLERKGFEADREAEHRASLAEQITAHLARGDSATTIGNRVERHTAEIRKISRSLAHGGSSAWDDRMRAERARLADAVKLDRATLARMVAGGKRVEYSRANVAKGDAVKIRGTWRRVVRANAKTVSVETGYSWTDTAPYYEIRDHRSETGRN